MNSNIRLLFKMDRKDYNPNNPRFIRPSACAIIQNGEQDNIFVQDNNYYFCEIEQKQLA